MPNCSLQCSPVNSSDVEVGDEDFGLVSKRGGVGVVFDGVFGDVYGLFLRDVDVYVSVFFVNFCYQKSQNRMVL